MTTYEVLDNAASAVAVLLSIAATILSVRANSTASKQAKVATLNNILVNIDSARARLDDHAAQLAPFSKRKLLADEQRQLDVLQQILESKIEALLNAYDDGCQRFLSGDVDSQAFRDKYFHSIKDLVEKHPDKFREPVTRFNNMVQVYRKWYGKGGQ